MKSEKIHVSSPVDCIDQGEGQGEEDSTVGVHTVYPGSRVQTWKKCLCVPQAEIEGSKMFPRTREIDILKNLDKYA